MKLNLLNKHFKCVCVNRQNQKTRKLNITTHRRVRHRSDLLFTSIFFRFMYWLCSNRHTDKYLWAQIYPIVFDYTVMYQWSIYYIFLKLLWSFWQVVLIVKYTWVLSTEINRILNSVKNAVSTVELSEQSIIYQCLSTLPICFTCIYYFAM